MVEQPRIEGVFQKARCAVITRLLDYFEGKNGVRQSRKILYDHFVLEIAKNQDFKNYASMWLSRPETLHKAVRLADMLDRNTHLPGALLLNLFRLPDRFNRAARAVESVQHLQRGVPMDEVILPGREVKTQDSKNALLVAAYAHAADVILAELHDEAAIKRTVVVRKKRVGDSSHNVHESNICLTPANVAQLRQLAQEAHI